MSEKLMHTEEGNDVEFINEPTERVEVCEEIDTAEELEYKKREIREFNAENNSAQNQIFIQDLGKGNLTFNYYSDKMQPISSSASVKKRYNLQEVQECIEFVETYRKSEYLVTVLLLGIFEAIDISEFISLKEKLVNFLPTNTYYDAEGNKIQETAENPYVALNSVLEVIGAKRFTSQEGKQCVTLGENSIVILNNVLEQFPVLRSAVVKMMHAMLEDGYSNIFYEYQIAMGMKRLYSLKIVTKNDSLFNVMYQNSRCVKILSIFIYSLYKTDKEDAEKILEYCLAQEIEGLWKCVSLVYALFGENKEAFKYEAELRKLLVKKMRYMRKQELNFMADILIQSKCFREMICSVFSEVYRKCRTRAEHRHLAQLYLYLVKNCYYRVSSLAVELPLVVCDTKQQQENLASLLEIVMEEYRLREQIYAVLKAYLREVSHYEFSNKTIIHTAAFCCNLSAETECYLEDIKDVLKECRCKAANEVYSFLEEQR